MNWRTRAALDAQDGIVPRSSCFATTPPTREDDVVTTLEDRLIHFLLLGGLPCHDQPGIPTPSIFSPGFPAGWCEL